MIRFGFHCELLDQTILQAISFFECYIAKNKHDFTDYLRELGLIALVLAIKNNEDKVLSLKECLVVMKQNIFAQPLVGSSEFLKNSNKQEFSLEMFAKLEQHMLLLLNFRLNVPTTFDFVLMFAHKVFEPQDA